MENEINLILFLTISKLKTHCFEETGYLIGRCNAPKGAGQVNIRAGIIIKSSKLLKVVRIFVY